MAAVRGTEAEDRRTVTEEIQVGIYKLNMCWTFAQSAQKTLKTTWSALPGERNEDITKSKAGWTPLGRSFCTDCMTEATTGVAVG